MGRLVFCIFSLFLLSAVSFADTPQPTFAAPQSWISKNATDVITINNGSGVLMVITINVDKGGAGIDIKNCGQTTHVDAGSTTVCSSGSSTDPVMFNSDAQDKPSAGTYQIKQ